MKNKQKLLVVIPTTASRLNILMQVLDSLYANNDFDIKTIIVKNGTIDDEQFFNYDLKYPNIIKTTSEPGGHLSKAMNKGLEYLSDEDFFMYQEDDLVITTPNWIKILTDLSLNTINCGVVGTRLHGGQRKYNPRKEYTIESLKVTNTDTFEVYWTDGITLVNADIIKKHNIKYDEFMLTVPNADLNLQMIENGYENWRTELEYNHYHTPGSKTGTAKWKHADTYIDMQEDNFKLWLKYKDNSNQKIKEFVDMDLAPHGQELKKLNMDNIDYKKFKYLIKG